MLDLAGASNAGAQGTSLRPALGGEGFKRDPVVCYARRRMVVIDPPYKLHIFQRAERKDRLILFDLSLDPGETKDISSEKKDVLERLAAVPRDAGAAED